MKAMDRPWRHHKENRTEAPELKPDLDEARRFLSILDASATAFTFATFDDGPKPKRAMLINNCLHGDLESQAGKLASNNGRGAGVFVMVNEGDGRGRASKHVTRIRAVWGEFDDGMPASLPLAPSMTVETSPGKFHAYWICDDLPIDEHRPIIDRIVRDYGGDRQAVDDARVLRVPGFFHRKGEPFLSRIVDATGELYSREQLIAAFPPYVEERVKAPPPAAAAYPDDDENDREKLLSALEAIPSDPRDTWVKVGMALKHKFGDGGRSIWEQWASKSEKYDEAGSKKWASFGRRDGVTVGSIFHWAKENGWKWEQPAYREDPGISQMIKSMVAKAEQKHKAEAANVVAFPVPEIPAPENPSDDFAFDGEFKAEMPPALIRKLLPRNGLVVDGGQSGAGKTFAEVDMAVALASGQEWFGQPVRERVGVVYIAAEGQSSIQRRFIAAKRLRGVEDDKLPLAISKWSSVNLRDLKVRKSVILKLLLTAKHFQEQHGVRLGAIIIDTVSAACPMKDENSNAEIAIICRELREIADATDAILIAVHHFGKSEGAGLRGGSAWRANCDHSRVFLADRESMEEPAKNRRMALEKNRLGPEGETIGFDLEEVSFGKDQYGDEMSECGIAIKGQVRAKRKLSKPERDFVEVFRKAAAAYVHTEIYGLRPHPSSIPIDMVREAFEDTVVTGQARLTPQQANTKNQKWKRVFEDAQKRLFATELINQIEWIWPVESL